MSGELEVQRLVRPEVWRLKHRDGVMLVLPASLFFWMERSFYMQHTGFSNLT
jgi:hypothetical protein